MELEIPEMLAAVLRSQVGAQSPLGLQLGGQGACSGIRVVSSRHFDGRSLNLLYQLSLGNGARDLVFQLLALDNLNGESQLQPIANLEAMVPALTEWLARDAIDGWLYQRGKDGVLLPWLVHTVRLVKPTEGNAYVLVGLLANTLQAAGREPPSELPAALRGHDLGPELLRGAVAAAHAGRPVRRPRLSQGVRGVQARVRDAARALRQAAAAARRAVHRRRQRVDRGRGPARGARVPPAARGRRGALRERRGAAAPPLRPGRRSAPLARERHRPGLRPHSAALLPAPVPPRLAPQHLGPCPACAGVPVPARPARAAGAAAGASRPDRHPHGRPQFPGRGRGARQVGRHHHPVQGRARPGQDADRRGLRGSGRQAAVPRAFGPARRDGELGRGQPHAHPAARRALGLRAAARRGRRLHPAPRQRPAAQRHRGRVPAHARVLQRPAVHDHQPRRRHRRGHPLALHRGHRLPAAWARGCAAPVGHAVGPARRGTARRRDRPAGGRLRGASGRDIKELLKLTSKYCRRKELPLSTQSFAQCAVFRGIAPAASNRGGHA